jgi:integrase
LTRRGAHEGTIRERTDGRREARYRTTDGRRRSVFAKTRGEVVVKLRAALTSADAGLPVLDQRVTLATYLGEWLRDSVRPRCRPATLESYSLIVHRYLAPRPLGAVPLAKLQPANVQRLLADLTAAGTLSGTTVRYACSVLRIALNRAVKQGRIIRTVAALADPPAKATPEMRPLTGAEVGTILESVEGSRHAALYLAAIGTGLRQGELLGLRWSDIVLQHGTLTVRHTLQRRTRTLGEPKTDRAKRTLGIASEVLAGLREHELGSGAAVNSRRSNDQF